MSGLDIESINTILGINEPFKAPTRIMEIMFDRTKREQVFRRMLAIDSDVSVDWFHAYFEEEQADRKKNKQDFTPDSISDLVSRLTESEGAKDYTVYDPTAGTGGLLIRKWWGEYSKPESLWAYRPQDYIFFAEELSDRALPFLLFNLTLRGLNAVVVHGDTLERSARGVFLIENDMNDYLGFSSLNVFPRNEAVMREVDIRSWDGDEYPEHVESPLFMDIAGYFGLEASYATQA
jgi:hypothetical protein